jgi:hypothetical protein
MNCSLASLEISTGQVHQNKAVNLGESPQVDATNYTHAETVYPAIEFRTTAGVLVGRWLYSDSATRDADYLTATGTQSANLMRAKHVARSNPNTTPFLLVGANYERKTVIIKNTTNVAMQIKYENTSTPTISATSYTRTVLASTITSQNELEITYQGAISARFNSTPNANPIFTTETF